ncbi:HAMP domain-containing sensor histidine kinase [uncultured Methylovirgula sp.]|uniref:sensor histidine kinase n=1 Tax=uncultured Methylovirgula sp. TaxID=1285960 RepID=UPI0026209A81|nr:HAMP domain-containing sensor histidine kinase [uncultured Methylovirgula sp.]
MGIGELLRSTAFRLAVVFALVVTLATSAVFGFVYWRVANSDMARARISLADEVAKAATEPAARLMPELERRLTRDLRQIEYVGLFDAKGKYLYGNVTALPPVPLDGRSHITWTTTPDGTGRESAFFVGRVRPDGGTLIMGRGLYEIRALQQSVLRALAIGIGPTILLSLIAGIVLSLRAARRLNAIHLAIDRVVEGDLHERLPASRVPDGIDDVVRSVNRMLDEIARLVNQLRQVGDNIAHDLRTPLTVAHLRLERALDEPEEQLRATARQILADLDRALTTVTALLRISQLESGLQRSAFAPLDLVKLCRDIVDFYEPLAEAKSITLTLEAPSKVSFVGDQDLLHEALTNLIDNAIKFTPKNGLVKVSVGHTPDGPRVEVRDNGPGIAAQDRDKIFKRFYRAAATGHLPGNGLGLNMAATIADVHGLTLRLGETSQGACLEIVPARQENVKKLRPRSHQTH